MKKKKSHKLYAFMVLFLGIVIIALAFLLLFHVQKIQVRGNEYTSKEAIVETVTQDKLCGNSLYVLARQSLGYGEELPCMSSTKISIPRPWILRITVKEKPIVGFLYDEGQEYVYFDKEGLVVKKDTQYIEGIPQVEGIEVSGAKLYKQIKSENVTIFEEILEASQELQRQELTIEKIVCKEDRIYLYINDICINLGDSVTSEKIAQLPPILEKLGKKKGTLHLENFAEGKETITFDIDEKSEEN